MRTGLSLISCALLALATLDTLSPCSALYKWRRIPSLPLLSSLFLFYLFNPRLRHGFRAVDWWLVGGRKARADCLLFLCCVIYMQKLPRPAGKRHVRYSGWDQASQRQYELAPPCARRGFEYTHRHTLIGALVAGPSNTHMQTDRHKHKYVVLRTWAYTHMEKSGVVVS